MRYLLTLLLLTTAVGPAWAGDAEDELREQIEQLVARNAWSGADRAYEILSERGVRMGYREHWLGGQAAGALGDAAAALDRFELAKKIDDTQEIQDQIQQIHETYGSAKLKVPGNWSGGVPLRTRDAIIDPTQRLVIERAKTILGETGKFNGLLPQGRYMLGETAFEVTGDKTAKAKL